MRDLDRVHPSIADLEATVRGRIPKFAYDYMMRGTARNECRERNVEALRHVDLVPEYLIETVPPLIETRLFGRTWRAPFGVAPVGLGGLIWPRAAELAAAAATRAGIPFVISTYATTSLERIAEITEGNAWFQLYTPNVPEVRRSLIGRAKSAGYEVLLVTVDVPARTRQIPDMKNGLSVPPRFDLRTVLHIVKRPAWALAMLRAGVPTFENLTPYVPEGASLGDAAHFLSDMAQGHISVDTLRRIRDEWPGKMVVKGILAAADARRCVDVGADGVVVSNHGGRQLDAAVSAVEALSEVRAALGRDVALIADGGVRSGLDLARMHALGADFVLCARAVYFGIAAHGARGADHAIHVLREELEGAMRQTGVATLAELPGRLRRAGGAPAAARYRDDARDGRGTSPPAGPDRAGRGEGAAFRPPGRRRGKRSP